MSIYSAGFPQTHKLIGDFVDMSDESSIEEGSTHDDLTTEEEEELMSTFLQERYEGYQFSSSLIEDLLLELDPQTRCSLDIKFMNSDIIGIMSIFARLLRNQTIIGTMKYKIDEIVDEIFDCEETAHLTL